MINYFRKKRQKNVRLSYFFAVYLYDRMHIAARIKVCNESHGSWLQVFEKRIVDLVGSILMGDMAMHKAIDVEFDRLELYYFFPWHIVDAYRGKIGIAGAWAKAHKFGKLDRDCVALFVLVWPKVLCSMDIKFSYLFFAIFHQVSFNCKYG